MPATTMKALRKVRPERGAQLESVPVPGIGPNEVLVRVRAASICGTDLHIYGWDRWSQSRIKPPLTFGHEFCGVVERVGEEVSAGFPRRIVYRVKSRTAGQFHPRRPPRARIFSNLPILWVAPGL